ncbi:hypothetical protein M408DRAFT_220249 [Serendipita vermifera MAFF 305830]|uniref:Uncharacterized protein n=1 Tax=Serendipita vermifera MAFF 305830 TaxID=933852 RepID=A0A0C3B6R4_SERVB|nr:hypothetical protein M408DRAFT_220249 [Serendipita vermifera MAFF 305830]
MLALFIKAFLWTAIVAPLTGVRAQTVSVQLPKAPFGVGEALNLPTVSYQTNATCLAAWDWVRIFMCKFTSSNQWLNKNRSRSTPDSNLLVKWPPIC